MRAMGIEGKCCGVAKPLGYRTCPRPRLIQAAPPDGPARASLPLPARRAGADASPVNSFAVSEVAVAAPTPRIDLPLLRCG
jgi:hypothetical protein